MVHTRYNKTPFSAEFIQTPSKEYLDDLFSPMYKEYFKKRSREVSTNSAAHTTLNNKDTPSSSLIIVEDNEVPPIISSSAEQTSPILDDQKSEYAKRLENKKAGQLTQSQSGTMDNYVIKILHVSSLNNEDVDGGDNNDEYVDMNVDEDGVNITDDINNEDVNNEDVDDVKLDDDDDGVPVEETNIDYDDVEVDINVDIFDPRN
ncbi:hypothetical protein Tco_0564101 [Tanacetum coccineum]